MLEPLDDAAVRLACLAQPVLAQLEHTRVSDQPNAWRYGDAVAIRFDYWGPAMFAAVGHRDVGSVVRALGAEHAGADVVVPFAARDCLAGADDVHIGFAVATQATREVSGPLDTRAANAPIRWLTTADETAIERLLDTAFPHASTRPGSGHVRRWAGVDIDGELVACVADCTARPDLGYVASLAVAPAHRGAGLGRRVLMWVVAQLIEDHGRVGLWWHDELPTTRDWYGRLGFELHPMATGRIPTVG